VNLVRILDGLVDGRREITFKIYKILSTSNLRIPSEFLQIRADMLTVCV
jgi:hypothetical protein